MTIEQKIENSKKFVPEIQEYDIEVVKKFYEIAEKTHPEEKEDLLRVYLLGYLLTAKEDINFEEIQISNVLLKEGSGIENDYLRLYKNLRGFLRIDEEVTVGIS